MQTIWPQVILVAFLILLNAIFAGAELALVSLREGQLRRLQGEGGRAALLAELARDPNRFMATIQIVITLAGFFASASAAVTLSRPLGEVLTPLGDAAGPTAVVVVTLAIAYVTLVVGELAPKRLAMQRAEAWGLLVARPLALLGAVTRPLVWLLSRSADLVVRLLGGDPHRRTEEVTEEEVRDLVWGLRSFTTQQQEIIAGAFDISERSLREVLRPRRAVVVLEESSSAAEGVDRLLEAGYSRAPVAPQADLDHVSGVVHLRDLIGRTATLAELARPPLIFPETVDVLDALRVMQQNRQHMAVVIDEHGSSEGIVTIEDLLEELVGEIYDESDRDVMGVVRLPGGALEVPGGFPIHDLVDVGVDLPPGDYTTVAGLLLEALGRIPDQGDEVAVGGWRLLVVDAGERAITRVRMVPNQE